MGRDALVPFLLEDKIREVGRQGLSRPYARSSLGRQQTSSGFPMRLHAELNRAMC